MRAAVGEGAGWEVVVSSPLVRCTAFATEFSRREGIALHTDERLRELHFGEWEGMSSAQLMRGQPEDLARFWNNPYRNTPPGGETLRAFERRVLAVWQDVIWRYRRERVLVVTHAGVIRIILCHVRRLPRSALLSVDVPHASLRCISARSTRLPQQLIR